MRPDLSRHRNTFIWRGYGKSRYRFWDDRRHMGWTSVRGSVTGNILTVECEDGTSTDTISWMVVAERHDTHIMETDWTDGDGHIILEPEKPEEP